ncbi:hypothetical protein KQH49_05890 [Mycetohabitans sp. B5]|uniref:Transmembrane protein n=1 Tax=Mycetohabitans endofungorum TaxID=417203 RepID=A0A2P5KBZ0_9BURK|nr:MULTISPECIES: hypothetical protein [Mycetohabitans]MCG1054516.1 hypothetical protein [Mycetohabitans sp. B5]PPB84237.1 hypothetical protein B0O95_104189 [Mycetohabitans endofungorum]
MKALLRAVLIVDALVTAAFGLLMVATPWRSLYDTLQLVQVSPAMVGQLFGIVLLALAGLQLRAAVHGALTAPVAGASGHALWACGVLMLVWLVAVRSPSLVGLGLWIGPLVGVALLLYGLINVRLAAAVRRRDWAAAQGAASAERARKRAAAMATMTPAQAADVPTSPAEPAGRAPATPATTQSGASAPNASPSATSIPAAGPGADGRREPLVRGDDDTDRG